MRRFLFIEADEFTSEIEMDENDKIMNTFAKFATVIVIIALLWAMISQLVK